jgi:hypothetical protein
MTDTLYRIQVEMLLTGGLDRALGEVGASLLGIDKQVNNLTKSFGGWGPAIAAGGAAIAFGLIANELVRAEEAGEKLPAESDGLAENSHTKNYKNIFSSSFC